MVWGREIKPERRKENGRNKDSEREEREIKRKERR